MTWRWETSTWSCAEVLVADAQRSRGRGLPIAWGWGPIPNHIHAQWRMENGITRGEENS
ncbi:MAG: hypothetical protein GY696_21035 [Gammaproteobacteria bacterium]|nr:hypothetical protein [Gammaproteobacteria bacterium]